MNPNRPNKIEHRRSLISLGPLRHRDKQIGFSPSQELTPEEININGTKLTLIPVEHIPETTPAVVPKIAEVCDRTNPDLVVFEYYSDEIRAVEPKAITNILTNAESIAPFFDAVAKGLPNKEIARLDPAYCAEFGLLRTYALGIPIGVASGLSVIAGKTVGTVVELPPIARRLFLKLSALAIISFCVGFMSSDVELSFEQAYGMNSPFYSEPDYRRAVVAKHLQTLTTNPNDRPSNVCVIYPPFHLNSPSNPRSIKALLQNPKIADDILTSFSWIDHFPEIKAKLETGVKYSKEVNGTRQKVATFLF